MKKITAILVAICIFSSFSGCGSSKSMLEGSIQDFSAAQSSEKVMADGMEEEGVAEKTGMGFDDNTQINSSAQEDAPSEAERKIIWTVNMDLETKDMDTLLESFNAQIEQTGGYIENSSISGKRADDYSGQRYASITARIPSNKLDGFLETMGELATVINTDKERQDITFQYTDTENRLKSLKIEQDKLYELLEKATDLNSIILLEERLTEVLHQIENYTSALKLYDNQVYYSTVHLYIHEVYRVTEQVDRSLSSRISTGFSDTLYSIRSGSENLLVFVIVNSPFFVILALVMAIVVLIIKTIDKSVKNRKSALLKDQIKKLQEQKEKEEENKSPKEN